MARRKWTLVVLSDGLSGSRRLRLNREIAQIGIAAALLLFAVLGSLGTRLLFHAEEAVGEHILARRAALLEAELESLETQVDSLRSSLGSLEDKDEFYRLLAGLEPIDPEVRQVGIGGPGLETVESHSLSGVDPALAGYVHQVSSELGTLARRARLLSLSWVEARQTLEEKVARLQATPSIVPTVGWVSSGFSSSRWHPILSRPRPHLGIDIVAPRGTPIIAAARGRVRSVGVQGEYGLTIEVDHGFGTATRYAHTSKTSVRVGQPVERGDVIGFVGQSGLAIGPHLHYEVLVNGRQMNPRRFIFDGQAIPD